MPFVKIKITREGATKEQKEKLIRGATQLLEDVLGKNPATNTGMSIVAHKRLAAGFKKLSDFNSPSVSIASRTGTTAPRRASPVFLRGSQRSSCTRRPISPRSSGPGSSPSRRASGRPPTPWDFPDGSSCDL